MLPLTGQHGARHASHEAPSLTVMMALVQRYITLRFVLHPHTIDSPHVSIGERHLGVDDYPAPAESRASVQVRQLRCFVLSAPRIDVLTSSKNTEHHPNSRYFSDRQQLKNLRRRAAISINQAR